MSAKKSETPERKRLRAAAAGIRELVRTAVAASTVGADGAVKAEAVTLERSVDLVGRVRVTIEWPERRWDCDEVVRVEVYCVMGDDNDPDLLWWSKWPLAAQAPTVEDAAQRIYDVLASSAAPVWLSP